jgi:hypothetical protein
MQNNDALDLKGKTGNLSSHMLLGTLSIERKPDKTLHCKSPHYTTDRLLAS